MNRIRGGAAVAAGLALLSYAEVARAQDVTGRVTGRVTDKDTGTPLGGVTVIAQGPQGEDATLTDDRGDYFFTSLPIGTYVVRFYIANATTQVEQGNVVVSAEKMVRVNVKIESTIAAAAATAAQQTYVIAGRPPTIDVGSTRVGAQFDEDFTLNVPLGRTYGDVIQRAPGVFFDPSGNVSIGGATGLENIYIVNGMNVTGVEYGNLESGLPSTGGGTNLPVEFLTQIDVNSGGYQAEFGGAMGGVINSVLKSGSNQYNGSAFTYWAPYWLSASPKPITTVGGSLGYVRKPDYDISLGAEAGGPIIPDKLFLWVGFAPRFTNSHVFRQTYISSMDLDANGNNIQAENKDWRARINETRRTYYFATTLDFIPRPEHHLTVSLFGSPNSNTQMRTFNGVEFISQPAWAREELTKNNVDATAHWTSKLFDRRWQIDAFAGMHREYFNDRSPDAALNAQNQQEYRFTNLWDLERAPGCQPITQANGDIFQPCPVDHYHTGGFGLVKQYTAYRWTGEIKSTHLIEAGGHHELKYGWRLEFANFDQERYYSGPLGSRALVTNYPQQGTFDTNSFFTLQPGQFPATFGPNPNQLPFWNLLQPPVYQDSLNAYVTSLSNAFFLQDAYTPKGKLRNLTVNAGVRLELQTLKDFHGNAFLDTKNVGPRIGAIYDPFGDGRSKISVAYGRYFEAIPLNMSARYFGGEGLIGRNNTPYAACPVSDPYTGSQNQNNWRECGLPPAAATDAAGGYFASNNGQSYAVQKNLAGQYHNEIVATAERELREGMTLRLDYQHRWLGTIIEDGSADPSGTYVLANPGHVPQSAIEAAQREAEAANAEAAAYRAAHMNDSDPLLESAAANANAKLTTLEGLKNAPKPERTYDAITFSLNQRFTKNWLARASYTYSRLVGNYEGLYQAEQNYFAPNGNNSYDYPDLYNNQNGPLPNDRPHHAHIDGYYTRALGKGHILLGLSFSALSGMPRNYMAALVPQQQLVFLLPRGAGGRTPTTTELNGKISYRRELSPKVSLEVFLDLFNLFNQQEAILTDDNYTFNMAPSIVNGTPSDLAYAKSFSGAPLAKNPNYGHALAYQQPFHGRFGLRLTF
jgi:hypothetical protein